MKLTWIAGRHESGELWMRDLGGECHVTTIAGRLLVMKPDGAMYFVDSEGKIEETRLMRNAHFDDGV